mgnify:CR=1 FL=1
MKKIAVFGAGGCGREVKWVIDDINRANPLWEFIGFFDDDFSNAKNIDPRFFLGGMNDLNQWSEPLSLVFGIGNPVVKRKLVNQVSNPNISFPTLVHPSALLSGQNISLGEGSVIYSGTAFMFDIKVGKHVLISLHCTIGHDAVIGDYSSIMPSVNISGEVVLGEAVYCGTGGRIIGTSSRSSTPV